MYLLKVQKKLCYASAIYWRVLAIYSISWALKNVILSLRTVNIKHISVVNQFSTACINRITLTVSLLYFLQPCKFLHSIARYMTYTLYLQILCHVNTVLRFLILFDTQTISSHIYGSVLLLITTRKIHNLLSFPNSQIINRELCRSTSQA